MREGSLPPQAALLPWVHAGQVAEHLPAVLSRYALPAPTADLRTTVARLEDTNRLLRQTVVRLRALLRQAQQPDAEWRPKEVRCGHCLKWLPADAFSVDRGRKTGRRGWCRACDQTRWQRKAQKAGAA